MLEQTYAALAREAEGMLARLGGNAMDEAQFDRLTERLIVPGPLDDPGRLYCRDGLVLVQALDRETFQIACWQINSFAPGVFSGEISKKCTPLLLTVKVHGAHPYLNHSLRTIGLSVDALHLGRHYSGSKGEQCNRSRFQALARRLFEDHAVSSYEKRLSYLVSSTNLICHHIAETISYGLGALEIHWERGQNVFRLSSGAWLGDQGDMLHIEILDDFAGDDMEGRFEVPHYDRLRAGSEDFHEGHDMLLWDVSYRNERECFCLPSGYQKIHERHRGIDVNVVTTQHMLVHLLSDFFQRENAFVVANTFQTLEYLSRAILVIQEGGREEGVGFLKSASSCLGHYPENDVERMLAAKAAGYPSYASEYFYKTFFRAPVLS